MRRLASVVLIAALFAPVPSYALCAMPLVRPKVLTPDVTSVDGGIVVGTDIGFGNDPKGPQGEAAQPTWVIKTKTGQVKPVMVTLAPGLVAYRLPDKVDAGELFDGTQAIAKIARGNAPAAKLPAPVASKVTHKLWPNRRGNSEATTVILGGDVPADALALVVVDARTLKPRSYGLVQAGAKEIAVYSRGRCSAHPDGTSPARSGEKIILRWVDKTGVVSADSKPITVVKG